MSTPTPTGPSADEVAAAIPAPSPAADEHAATRPSGVTPGPRKTDWPAQLTLSGQTAAPDGPIELSGMFLMHHAFRRDLVDFSSAAARTPVGDRATWKALGKRWARFGKVLHKHHSAEDAGLWPRLMERVRLAGHAEAVETLQAMAEEHRGIDPVLVSSSAGFARLASTADERIRAGLSADVAELNTLLHAHLEHEETQALVIVQQHLGVEEWKAFEEEVGKDYKPWDIPFALCWAL